MRLGAVMLVLATAGAAVAQEQPAPDSPEQRADALFEQGSQLFTEGADYEAARRAFEESYALRPSWKALNGIAATYQEEGRSVEALASYERLLAEFGGELSADQVARVRRRIDGLAARIGVLHLDIVKAGTVVKVNGEEVGRGPGKLQLRRLPGPYAVEATLAGHHPYARSIVLAAGGTEALRIDLVPESERVVVKVEQPPLVRRMPRWLPWVTLGGGAVLAGAGGLLTYAAASDFEEFDRELAEQAGEIVTPSEGDSDLRKSGERKRDLAVGLYVAGGAAAAAGVVLLILNQPRPARAQLGPGPGDGPGLGFAIAF